MNEDEIKDFEGKTTDEIMKEHKDLTWIDLRKDKKAPIKKDAALVEVFIDDNFDVKIKAPTKYIPVQVAEALCSETLRKTMVEELEKEVKERERMAKALDDIKVRAEKAIKNDSFNPWRLVCIIQSIIFILALLKVGGII